jgi:hypothetical protein
MNLDVSDDHVVPISRPPPHQDQLGQDQLGVKEVVHRPLNRLTPPCSRTNKCLFFSSRDINGTMANVTTETMKYLGWKSRYHNECNRTVIG